MMRNWLVRVRGFPDAARLANDAARWRGKCRDIEPSALALRRELADVRDDLNRTRIDLDEARGSLRVAEAENLGTWQLVKRFHAQWDADIASIARRMAGAENDRRDAEALDDAA